MKNNLTKEQKMMALENAHKTIVKKYGKGSAYKLTENTFSQIDRISSGSILLDNCLGGGFPKGRITEIFGPESSGKTTVAIHAMAEAQRNDGVAAFCDAEQAFDPDYAAALGVNLNELAFAQPNNGEEAIEIVEQWILAGVDIIVIDSVAALVPQAELDGSMADQQMGLQARLMSKACRRLIPLAQTYNTSLIFINQIREKIGVMYGNPETTTGGRALKFYSSIRLDIRKKDPIKVGTKTIGNKTHFKTVKNKTFPPHRECDINILYGQGIDKVGEAIDLGVECGLIDKAGSWFTYKDLRKQGKEAIQEAIIENDLLDTLMKQVEESLNENNL